VIQQAINTTWAVRGVKPWTVGSDVNCPKDNDVGA